MKKLSFLLLFFLLSAAYAAPGERYVDHRGKFSYIAPAGWQFRNFPGLKFRVAVGPSANKFTPNINIVDEEFRGDLKEYVDKNLENLPKIISGFKLLDRKPFTTASGLQGEKLITTSKQNNQELRQLFYIFPAADRDQYLVVTCSLLAFGGAALDIIFDKSLSTFQLLKKSW